MDIKQIIAALEESKGPDLVIDFWISCRLFDPSPYTDEELQADMDLIGINQMIVDRLFTSSIDAALELGLKLLPEWGFQVGRPCQKYLKNGYYACCFPGNGTFYDGPRMNERHYSPNGAIALCLAILRGYADTSGDKP